MTEEEYISKNRRRVELIMKRFNSSLAQEEITELTSLEQETANYMIEHYPIDTSVLETLEKAVGREVRCIKNDGFEVSLKVGKVYLIIPNPSAEAEGFYCVIDDNGDDYLYPKEFFDVSIN